MTKVLVLYTGGTIGALPIDPGDPDSPLHPASRERLQAALPDTPGGIDWVLRGLEDDTGAPVPPLDSSSVGPDHWRWLAAAVGRDYAAYDGFVILHGTDTLAYTGSALSFLLRNLGKPVVLTGAQIPIHRTGSDAGANFSAALRVAGWRATGLPCLPEVMIAFGDRLLRANRATKISASALVGFDSPNAPPLGRIASGGQEIGIATGLIRAHPDPEREPFAVESGFDPRVMVVSLFPGLSAPMLHSQLSLAAVRGFVLRSFGAGNAPMSGEFHRVLAQAVAAGRIVVNVTQCLEGTVDMGRYAAGAVLRSAGVISGLDLTTEAALTKLMWLLGTVAAAGIPALMQRDLRGELTAHTPAGT